MKESHFYIDQNSPGVVYIAFNYQVGADWGNGVLPNWQQVVTRNMMTDM